MAGGKGGRERGKWLAVSCLSLRTCEVSTGGCVMVSCGQKIEGRDGSRTRRAALDQSDEKSCVEVRDPKLYEATCRDAHHPS